MNAIKTIDDVVLALDVIVRNSISTNNSRGYFAALYKRMTMAVREGIKGGQFEDGQRMEKLVIYFASRYLQAYEAFDKEEECSSSWQCAFDGGKNKSLIVLQHLLLGINSHVNLDLAIAAATIAPGDSIHWLEKDFNQINVIIASLVDDVQHCLEEVWFPMRFLRNVINSHGVAVLNFSMGAARKTAWANALLLANVSEQGRAAHIKNIDTMVCSIGNRVINPGLWPGLLLRLVRFTEYNDVARTIRLIETTVR